jgi:hypothetical protein
MDGRRVVLGAFLALASCASAPNAPACSESHPACPNAVETPRPKRSTVLGSATPAPSEAAAKPKTAHIHVHGGGGQ